TRRSSDLNLGERWVHHENQTDGQRNIGSTVGKGIDHRRGIGKNITNRHSQKHGQEDPERKVFIQKREFFSFVWSTVIYRHRSFDFELKQDSLHSAFRQQSAYFSPNRFGPYLVRHRCFWDLRR